GAWYNNPIIKIRKGASSMPRIIPIRDLKNTTQISQMCKESKEPIFVTKNGYGDMVVMSLEAYEEKMMLLDVEAKLAQSADEFRAGRVMDARESLQKLREKHGL